MRAATAVAAVLTGVVLIAVLFNLFGSDTPTSPTASSLDTTTTTTLPPAPVTIIRATCAVEGYNGLDCDNLIDGADGEYQFNWNALAGTDTKVTITLTLDRVYKVSSIIWENLPDGDRYFQNYRAKSVTVTDGQANSIPFPIELKDQAGTTSYTYVSFGTSQIEIEVTNVYEAEERAGNIYSDFAIKDISIWGTPVEAVTAPPTTVATTTAG